MPDGKMVKFNKHCLLAVAFCVVFWSRACTTGLGKCPRMAYMEDFNLTKFSGHWYEIERSFYLMQVISSCVSVDLAENDDRRGQLEVAVTAKSRWSDGLTVSEGLATQTKRNPSLMQYKVVSSLPKVISRYLPGAGVYQVLDTDYKHYAIVYSCTNYGLIHTDLIWIWGRQKEIGATLRSRIYNFLSSKQLDSERLILPKNSNCTD